MRSPPPGWRGVSIVPADGGDNDGGGGAEARLTIVPDEKATPLVGRCRLTPG